MNRMVVVFLVKRNACRK